MNDIKNIVVQVRSNPGMPGYNDTVIISDNRHIIFASPMSSCPNPHKPSSTKKVWQDYYAWIADGDFKWECFRHWRRGNVLVVNGGRAVTTRNKNRKHGGARIMKQCLFHRGWTNHWRGSAGCLTFAPVVWPAFISMFEVGDKGDLRVKTY
jgi:hypothetical protein